MWIIQIFLYGQKRFILPQRLITSGSQYHLKPLIVNATPVLVGAAAFLGIMLLKKGAGAGTLQFSIAGADVTMDGLTPVINLRLGIDNPSDSTFKITSIVANVTANDNNIGNVSTYQQSVIGAKQKSYYTLPVRLSLIGVAMDIYNAISQGGGYQQNIIITGNANVDSLLVPINLNYTVG